MAVGFDNSSVALAVEQIAAQKNRIAIAGAVGTTAFTGKNCTPADGRLLHDMYFVEVKTPAQSTGAWDYYNVLATIPGDQAFLPLAEGGCPLVKQR